MKIFLSKTIYSIKFSKIVTILLFLGHHLRTKIKTNWYSNHYFQKIIHLVLLTNIICRRTKKTVNLWR